MSNINPACSPFEAELSALLDDELAPGRAVEVQAHLDDCADCRERYRQLCQVDLELASLPVAAVPADLRARLGERISADAPTRVAPIGPHGRSGTAPPLRRRWLSGRALVAGLSAAAAVALYAFVNRGGSNLLDGPAPVSPPLAIVEPEALEPMLADSPPRRPSAESEIAAAAAPSSAPVLVDLSGVSDEELAVVLELELIEDLDLIANLDLLERILVFEQQARG
jgi:hypothetical protein